MKKLLPLTIYFTFLFFGLSYSQPNWNPEICLVTVDSATSTYVSVIWNKPQTGDIDSFYIYRADSNQINFTKIAALSYTDSSAYDDIAVNVNNTWYSYMISAIDSNGIEGNKSDTANTCLLNVIPNIANGYFKCLWNKYNNDANTPTLVRCMWDSLGNTSGLQQIGVNWAPTLTSWNHTGYSQAAQSVYRLENEVSNACTPERGVIITSRSNVKNITNPLTLESNQELVLNKLVKVYPNPSTSTVVVEWNSALEIYKIECSDASGRLVEVISTSGNDLKQVINVSGYQKGLYFVSLFGNTSKQVRRIVVR